MSSRLVTSSFEFHWNGDRDSRLLRRALIASVLLHVAAAAAFVVFPMPSKPPRPLMYEVQVIPLPDKKPVQEAKVVEPPRPEAPKAEVTPEPPKPAPPKEFEKKPDPQKEEPRPVAKVEEKKSEPKPVEKKPEPKPQPPPKTEEKKVAKAPAPIQPVTPKPEPIEPQEKQTAIKMQQTLPPLLNAWGRLVQRKVEKFWTIPGGIRLDASGNEAIVSFWVDRNGNLLAEPEIVKHASDQSLAESGVKAIKLAAPLPPFPPEYPEREQQVVYVFTLVR